jgi:hypothetical protein
MASEHGLKKSFQGEYPKYSRFQNPEYEVHHVGLAGSQNVSFLVYKEKALGFHFWLKF